MGCVNTKCCRNYPASSEVDGRESREFPDFSNSIHPHDNPRFMLTERSREFASVPSHNFQLEYSVLTQRGYYPDSPDKENQDSFCVKTQMQGNPNLHFFGVFDGHGQFGTQCSNFVRDRLVDILSRDPRLSEDPVKAYNSAFGLTNFELHDSKINDHMSGTTAITALLCGDTLFVANVGDSRAVLAVKSGNRVIAEDLSIDQTPFRKDECERVKRCGARVLSVDQVEGLKNPDIQSWGDEENDGADPPRLWVKHALYPGTAFTRSIGDSEAEKIGVVAVPEVSTVQLTPDHLFFVVASDGVFEFMSSQAVVDMAVRYSDPRDACAAIAGESYKLWLEHENRTDDITIIIVNIKELRNSVSSINGGVKIKSAIVMMGKGAPNVSNASESEGYFSLNVFSDQPLYDYNLAVDRTPSHRLSSPSHMSEHKWMDVREVPQIIVFVAHGKGGRTLVAVRRLVA